MDLRRQFTALQSSATVFMAEVISLSLWLARLWSSTRARCLALSLLKDTCRAGDGGEATGGGVKTWRREGEGEETTKEGEEALEEGVARREEVVVELTASGAVDTPVGMGTTGD